MAGDQDEVPLSGGGVTHGVVRVGDTVRRPPTANSDFVRRLLHHFASRGFEAVPASLGTDERGRDVVGFVDGEVPADLGFHADETLRRAASLIRRFHDLSAELVATPAASAVGIEVVCHNDFSPCNFVFRSGAPVAIIDFDAAALGSRAHDLGYAAWLWLDLGSPEIDAADQGRRLAVFLDAYGMRDPGPVLAAMLEWQAILVAQGKRLGDAAMTQWAADCMEWTQRNDGILRGY
jgi:aminoglycoside phosphotransferase (APT) family kinase protein